MVRGSSSPTLEVGYKVSPLPSLMVGLEMLQGLMLLGIFFSWLKPAHGSLSMPVLQSAAHATAETPWRVSPPDPWDHSQWLHRVSPTTLVSRAGAENRTSVAPPPEAFAGSVLDLSRPWRWNPKMRTAGSQLFNYYCFSGMSRSHSNFLATSCQTMSNYVKLCQTNFCGVAIPVGPGCFLLLGSGSGWHPKSAGPNPI